MTTYRRASLVAEPCATCDDRHNVYRSREGNMLHLSPKETEEAPAELTQATTSPWVRDEADQQLRSGWLARVPTGR